MSFLFNNSFENLSARITNKGRQKVAEGNFIISYFQVGDSEYDYNFSSLDGTGINNPPQKVFTPLDKDSIIKYPYKLSESSVTGTTYGIPIRNSQVVTVKNNIGPAGFVTEYKEYDGTNGVSVVCNFVETTIRYVNGTNILFIPSEVDFSGCEYVTLVFSTLLGTNNIIQEKSNSLVYKILDVVSSSISTTLTLDRVMPDLNVDPDSLDPTIPVTVICNKCNPFYPNGYDSTYNCQPLPQSPESQQDPWKVNVVWSKKPAGMSEQYENLSGYSSNVFVSTKEFLGYNISLGQLYNTGTTITNSLGEEVLVLPEEQHSLAIVYYSEINSSYEPDKFFKYEDYIAHNDTEDIEYFEVYIPFLLYHRNTGTTIGARFFMDTTDYFIDSSAIDTKLNRIKFRYLIDEQNIKVGKVFVNHKTIIFDDQEIVAILDYKSNRKYTLPIPKVAQTSMSLNNYPLMNGQTGQTVYVSYLLEFFGMNGLLNGLHCNHYSKVTGTTIECDVTFKFGENDFRFMETEFSGYTKGYIANRLKVLVQVVNEDEELDSENWKIIDFTNKIPNHTPGDYIDPVNLRNKPFVITYEDYNNASFYNIDNYLEPEYPTDNPSSEPQFGDEQPFPGSIKLTRATDLQVLNFNVNLPEGEFTTTQNPTWSIDKTKKITEIALLDDNKDILIIAKTPNPISRVGTQVFSVKLDF